MKCNGGKGEFSSNWAVFSIHFLDELVLGRVLDDLSVQLIDVEQEDGSNCSLDDNEKNQNQGILGRLDVTKEIDTMQRQCREDRAAAQNDRTVTNTENVPMTKSPQLIFEICMLFLISRAPSTIPYPATMNENTKMT